MINYWALIIRNLCVFAVLPMAAGVAIGSLGWMWEQESSGFVENLLATEARVLRFVPGNDETLMDVEYLDNTGVKYTQRFHVDDTDAPQLRLIGKVSLVYDRRDPHKAELGHIVSANNEMLVDWLVVVLGGLLVVAGLGYLARQAKRIVEIGRLLRSGQVTQTEVRDSTMAPGGSVGRFTYAFRGPNGRWYEGKSPEMSASQLARWTVGRNVMVAYHAEDPRRNEADVFRLMEDRRRDMPQTA